MAEIDIKSEIQKYFKIFIVLVVLIGVAVGVSSFKLNLGWTVSIPLILGIACVMGYLVSWQLMHLSLEKKVILLVLALAATFFISMMFLFYASHFSIPEGAKFVS